MTLFLILDTTATAATTTATTTAATAAATTTADDSEVPTENRGTRQPPPVPGSSPTRASLPKFSYAAQRAPALLQFLSVPPPQPRILLCWRDVLLEEGAALVRQRDSFELPNPQQHTRPPVRRLLPPTLGQRGGQLTDHAHQLQPLSNRLPQSRGSPGSPLPLPQVRNGDGQPQQGSTHHSLHASTNVSIRFTLFLE